MYGDTALRYSPTDVPSTLLPTTGDEIGQDYESVVGLEPEAMSAVVASGGDPFAESLGRLLGAITTLLAAGATGLIIALAGGPLPH